MRRNPANREVPQILRRRADLLEPAARHAGANITPVAGFTPHRPVAGPRGSSTRTVLREKSGSRNGKRRRSNRTDPQKGIAKEAGRTQQVSRTAATKAIQPRPTTGFETEKYIRKFTGSEAIRLPDTPHAARQESVRMAITGTTKSRVSFEMTAQTGRPPGGEGWQGRTGRPASPDLRAIEQRHSRPSPAAIRGKMHRRPVRERTSRNRNRLFPWLRYARHGRQPRRDRSRH